MPALLLSPLARWAAVGIVIALLVAGLFWFKHEATVARESQAVAERQAAISAADAERWQKASGERDAAIEQLKGAYAIQTERVKQGRANEAALSAALEGAHARNTALQEQADQLSRDLADEVQKMPADVREVGPIVARRAPALFE